jgi:hypothetical protein
MTDITPTAMVLIIGTIAALQWYFTVWKKGD